VATKELKHQLYGFLAETLEDYKIKRVVKT